MAVGIWCVVGVVVLCYKGDGDDEDLTHGQGGRADEEGGEGGGGGGGGIILLII